MVQLSSTITINASAKWLKSSQCYKLTNKKPDQTIGRWLIPGNFNEFLYIFNILIITATPQPTHPPNGVDHLSQMA
jgi:hypothetical protein